MTLALPRDPRAYQIAVLSGLLLWGALSLDFALTPARAALVIGSALGAQWLLGRWAGLPRFEPCSALISGLSLCLLLRTGVPALAAAGSLLAIGSKFALRIGGKHVFNPTNFALAVLMIVTDAVWVSPGQWGTSAFLAFLIACLGGMVVHRALRSDVTLAFLAGYAAVLFGRAAWLGDPVAIPLHQLQSGSLLLFSFFMISDPKTTPDARAGRLLFGVLVALGAGVVQFVLFRPSGPIWSLFVLSPLVPLLDRVLPGAPYAWPHGGLDVPSLDPARGIAAARPAPVPGPGVLRLLRRQG
jgi:Na+-translocating ferredoxin:NAD+ oxidoreductase RnfD subunit